MESFKKPPNNESPGLNWSFRDFFISLSVIFFALAVMVFVITKAKHEGENAGPLLVLMHWENTSDSDIDLWIKAPDGETVGYSHPNDILCDHLRDDLGISHDQESNNSEETVCRKGAEGDWAVNVMAYSVTDTNFPIWVDVWVKEMKDGQLLTLLYKRVLLTSVGEQITIWRFSLDKFGTIVPGSINDLAMQMGPEPTSLIGSDSPGTSVQGMHIP